MFHPSIRLSNEAHPVSFLKFMSMCRAQLDGMNLFVDEFEYKRNSDKIEIELRIGTIVEVMDKIVLTDFVTSICAVALDKVNLKFEVISLSNIDVSIALSDFIQANLHLCRKEEDKKWNPFNRNVS